MSKLLCNVLKISGGGQMPQIYSSLRQSNLQLQNQAAQRSRQIRAVEHWRWRCAAGLAGAHSGLQDRVLLKRINYARKCLFFVMYRYPQARNLGGRLGEARLRKIFDPTGKICWTYFETIAHCLKNLSTS